MNPVRNTIIIQFTAVGAAEEWERLIQIEEVLIQAFSQNGHAKVDGHDFGNDTVNIFVFPRGSWDSAITIIKAHLKHHNVLDEALIIRRLKSGRYNVAWPEKFDGDFERL